MNLQSILKLVIVGLILCIIYYVLSTVISGTLLLLVGAVLIIAFIAYLLNTLGINL